MHVATHDKHVSMEMECLFFGESEKAFFKFEELDKNRRLNKPIYPKDYYGLIKDKTFQYEPKKDGEIRLISCDIAGMAGKENDASVFSIIRMIPNAKGFDRHVAYMESVVGGHTTTQALRIRQLFNDFDCDYLVLDTQSIGLGVYDQLVLPLFDKERNIEYEPWTCINDENMATRCIDQNAEKIIYSIKANQSFNSECAISMRDGLKKGKIRLLVSEVEGKEYLKKLKGYDSLDKEIQAKFESSFVQTTALINEMINLEGERNENTGHIKLKEPKSKRKDRYSSITYGNFIASEIERDLMKVDEIDYDDDLVYF